MKIERKKVSMQVFDRIKDMIRDGEFQPGDKLPTEHKLTEMFGVSRTPVREALTVLEASGLITSTQGGGNVVQPTKITNLMEETTFELVDPKEVLHLLEMRLILETESVALAAERRTDEDLKSMEKALLQLRETQKNEQQIGHESDIAFHAAIVQASHNPVLIHVMQSISSLYYKAVKYSLTKNMGIKQKREQVLQEHETIFHAIDTHQPEQARKAMQQHLHNARKKFVHELQHLEEK